MSNTGAIAYAVVALNELQKDNIEINRQTLEDRMIYLMDIYSENTIYKKYIDLEMNS